MNYKLRWFSVAVIIGVATIIIGCSRGGDSGPEIVFFYQDNCYKCDRMKDVLNDLLEEYPALTIEYYEMEGNQSLLWKLARRCGLGNSLAVPTIFVGDRSILGDGRAKEIALRDAVKECAENGCRSPLKHDLTG